MNGTITRMLGQLGTDPQSVAQLVEAVYEDIKRIAINRLQLKAGAPLRSLTLSPTHVAHEALIQLLRQHTEWKNRGQFFAIAARLVGRAIREHRRAKNAVGRGGRENFVAMPENAGDLFPDARGEGKAVPPGRDLPLELDELLEQLRERDEMAAEVFVLHLVGGHSRPEIGRMMDVSLSTVERAWSRAKQWFAPHLTNDTK